MNLILTTFIASSKNLSQILTPNKINNLSLCVATIVSATFLGFSKNEDDITKGIFFLPCTSYLYARIFLKKPWILLLYVLCFWISKKINDKRVYL